MIRAALLVALLAGSPLAAAPAVARVVTETDVVSPSRMRSSGLRCTNFDEHGFSLAKGRVERF